MADVKFDFRSYLLDELAGRRQKNPSYSLRAFARDLQLGPEWLSRILSGVSGMSSARAQEVAKRLNLDSDARTLFCNMVEAQHGRSESVRRQARQLVELRLAQRTQSLSLDAFVAIRDWYHLALLQLTYLPDFELKPAWIARRLGIQQRQAKEALLRLQKLKLLTQNERGDWVAPEAFVTGPDGTASEAVRIFHEQIMTRSLEALRSESMETRSVSTVLIPFDSRKVDSARSAIKEFRRTFAKRIPPVADRDSVYALAVQFVRVDRPD